MTEFEPIRSSDQTWLDEAHRRADTSEESAWTVWNAGAVKPRAELSAAAITAVCSFAWLTSRGAIDVSSNPWQGLMLDPVFPVPLFAHVLAAGMQWLDGPTTVVLLNVITRLLGAIACAGIAALTVNAGRRIGTVGEAWICGMLAGVVFTLSQGVTSAFTSAWPGALTVTCAVWGLAALSRAAQSRLRSAQWLIIGAALCALASAGHAYFGWLAVPLVGVAIATVRKRSISVVGPVCALGVWLAILALPIVHALLVQGERPDIFLGRVLRAPYPAFAERAPDWNVLLELGSQFHPLVWIFGLAAVLLLFQRHTRPATLAALVLLAIAGPLAPFLMNQYDRGAFPMDNLSIEIMAIGAFSIVFGLGLGASMQVIFRRAHSLGYRSAMATLVLAIVALHEWELAPDRRSDLSGAFAQTLLDGCPRRSILIVPDSAIAGTLSAAQRAYGHRRDVRIIPFDVIAKRAARQYYKQVRPNGVQIDTAYDTEQHAAVWQLERPLVANALLNAEHDSSARQSALNDLILWEFVRDNFSARPIAFAGIDAPWLHARAEVNGLVLIYPRVEAPLTDSMEAWLYLKKVGDLDTRDPELAEAITKILLSLSATRRAQNQGEEATRLAALATQYGGGESKPWIALARAAARRGLRDDARVYSETGLRFGGGDAIELAEILQNDFDAFDLVTKYRADLDAQSNSVEHQQRRHEMATELWAIDEIAVLADFMMRELDLGPPTAPNLYEVAATQAQLGNFTAARQHLKDAIALAPDDVASHLDGDGRFVLLELDHQPSPYQSTL